MQLVINLVCLIICFKLTYQQLISNEHDDNIDGIYGGENAALNQAPWQVEVMQIAIQVEGYMIFGGSIIGKRAVLTAAHCCEILPDELYLYVKYGGVDRNNLTFGSNVSKIIIHPEYENKELPVDLCVLKLSNEIVESKNVKIIEIADNTPANGTIGQVAGFGETETSRISSTLLSANVTIVSRDVCQQKWEDGSNITIYELCAESEHGSPCHGDSGGSLVINKQIVGIVSYGTVGCKANTTSRPGVYVNTAVFKKWILEQVNQ